ncbi:MAG: iron-containing alcohol dehydrogenase, partial [Rhodovulum sp.]
MTFELLTPGRIVFGRGAAAGAAARIAAMGRRVLLVRGGSVGFADALAADLRALGAEVLGLRGQGEPTLDALQSALAEARAFAPDAVAAIGGGSVIDLGKALAALVPSDRPPLDHLEVVGQGLPLPRPPLPMAALPTTAGTGAEATKNAVIGVPAHGRKVSLRDDRMIPALALVDPGLTDGCPWAVTLASGLDAVTQVIEPYLSARASPLTDALCRDAIPRSLAALVRLAEAEDAA